MLQQNQWLFEAPEALFEFKDMTREQMASFLRNKWNDNPILRRLAQAQQLTGQMLHRVLINILNQFQGQTGITVQPVPIGAVQRLRGRGNFASLRSRPGFLQIEQPVFQNTQTLLNQLRHELAFYYAGGLRSLPRLTNTPFNALDLLEIVSLWLFQNR
jgi:hypothetical protein